MLFSQMEFFRGRGNRLCGGDKGAMKTDEVCGRPLDHFAFASGCYYMVVFIEGTKGTLRQYRTNELVRWRMHFLSDAIAEIEGLLEVNRDFCKKQMAEKASPALQTNCAVVP